MPQTEFKSPLHQTVSTTETDFWNDSCAIGELTYAIEHGAVGATSNPTIVEGVLKQERYDPAVRILSPPKPGGNLIGLLPAPSSIQS